MPGPITPPEGTPTPEELYQAIESMAPWGSMDTPFSPATSGRDLQWNVAMGLAKYLELRAQTHTSGVSVTRAVGGVQGTTIDPIPRR